MWDAQRSGQTFASALETASRAQLQTTKQGKVLIGASSGGTTASYALPAIGDVTAADISEVCSRLLDLVDAIKLETPAITDAALGTEVLNRTQAVRALSADFSTMGGLH